MVSISAPARRAALTALSSFLAAAVGAFLRRTTGSQSCETGPAMVEWFECGFWGCCCEMALRLSRYRVFVRNGDE